jgi:hypothetical protein
MAGVVEVATPDHGAAPGSGRYKADEYHKMIIDAGLEENQIDCSKLLLLREARLITTPLYAHDVGRRTRHGMPDEQRRGT